MCCCSHRTCDPRQLAEQQSLICCLLRALCIYKPVQGAPYNNALNKEGFLCGNSEHNTDKIKEQRTRVVRFMMDSSRPSLVVMVSWGKSIRTSAISLPRSPQPTYTMPSLLLYLDRAWEMTVLPQPKAPGMAHVPAGDAEISTRSAVVTAFSCVEVCGTEHTMALFRDATRSCRAALS